MTDRPAYALRAAPFLGEATRAFFGERAARWCRRAVHSALFFGVATVGVAQASEPNPLRTLVDACVADHWGATFEKVAVNQAIHALGMQPVELANVSDFVDAMVPDVNAGFYEIAFDLRDSSFLDNRLDPANPAGVRQVKIDYFSEFIEKELAKGPADPLAFLSAPTALDDMGIQRRFWERSTPSSLILQAGFLTYSFSPSIPTCKISNVPTAQALEFLDDTDVEFIKQEWGRHTFNNAFIKHEYESEEWLPPYWAMVRLAKLQRPKGDPSELWVLTVSGPG